MRSYSRVLGTAQMPRSGRKYIQVPVLPSSATMPLDQCLGTATDAPSIPVPVDQTGLPRRNGQASPDPLHAADLALRTAETHLHLALREVQTLKRHNRNLLGALADAAARAVELQHDSQHDELTGLPNRRLLDAQLQPGDAGAFSAQRRFALLFIDLDDFKHVNDCHGHVVGDGLLVTVSQRIRSCLRAEDMACRFGGDEFVVLIADVEDQATIAGIAEKVRRHLDGDHLVAGRPIHLRASVGFARYPRDGEDIQTLLSIADEAMYRDKPSSLPVETEDDGTPYDFDADETPPDRRPLW